MITRDMWYRNPEVLFNIISLARDREQVFLSKVDGEMPVRNIFANYMDLLRKNFDAFNFFKREYNLYYSLARFTGFGLFSFNVITRREQRKAWNETCLDKMTGFDFGLDFDSEGLHDVMSAHADCAKVKALLDEYEVPYSLKFSGKKGFHIKIPSSQLPRMKITSTIEDASLFNWLKEVATLITLKLDTPTLDLGIFDPRRIWKTEYSWTCETGLIALPLSDWQFENFELEMVEPMTVLKAGLRNRGNLMRKGRDGALKDLVVNGLGVEWKELNS